MYCNRNGKAITVFFPTFQVAPGLNLMSEVLKNAGGTLIPLSTLVTPLPPQKLHAVQKSSPSPETCHSLEGGRKSNAQDVCSKSADVSTNSVIGKNTCNILCTVYTCTLYMILYNYAANNLLFLCVIVIHV